jgi:ketosteroid isomerase-like protein
LRRLATRPVVRGSDILGGGAAAGPSDQWARANQDAAAVAGLYAENGRFSAPGMESSEGPAAITQALQQLPDMGARSLEIEPVDVQEAGELNVEYGRYVLEIEPEGADTVTRVGKYVVVHAAQPDGSTKIMFDIFNSNSPPG